MIWGVCVQTPPAIDGVGLPDWPDPYHPAFKNDPGAALYHEIMRTTGATVFRVGLERRWCRARDGYRFERLQKMIDAPYSFLVNSGYGEDGRWSATDIEGSVEYARSLTRAVYRSSQDDRCGYLFIESSNEINLEQFAEPHSMAERAYYWTTFAQAVRAAVPDTLREFVRPVIGALAPLAPDWTEPDEQSLRVACACANESDTSVSFHAYGTAQEISRQIHEARGIATKNGWYGKMIVSECGIDWNRETNPHAIAIILHAARHAEVLPFFYAWQTYDKDSDGRAFDLCKVHV